MLKGVRLYVTNRQPNCTAFARDLATTITSLVHHLELLELEAGFANDSSAGSREVSLSGPPVGSVGSTIPLLQCTHTCALAKVHFTSDGSCTNVKPVLIIWCELLHGSSLHDVVILRDIKLGLTLEVLSASLDKLVGWDILDSDTAARHPA